MANAQDILNAINAVAQNTADISSKMDTVNTNLNTIEGKLDLINGSVQALDQDVKAVQQLLLWGFEQLITLGKYTNQSLFVNDQQNDTMICLLEQISTATCQIWNLANLQTELQEGILAATGKLSCLYAATHGDAALTLEREAELRRQIEVCCPPEPPEPVCKLVPCPKPRSEVGEPPETEPPPQIGPTPPAAPK